MRKLAINLNSNLATCWLKPGQYEGVKFLCDIALRFEENNVKARYRRALGLVKMGVEEARLDLEFALELEPNNIAVLKESGTSRHIWCQETS